MLVAIAVSIVFVPLMVDAAIGQWEARHNGAEFSNDSCAAIAIYDD